MFSKSLLLWTLLATARPTCAADLLPIGYFTRQPDFGELKISPDGAYFAVSLLRDGGGEIHFYTIQPTKPVYALATSAGTEIDDFYWVSATRLIYTIAQRSKGLEPKGTGEIFAINRDGTAAKALYGYRAHELNARHFDTGPGQNPESKYASATFVRTLRGDDHRVLICEQSWIQKGQHRFKDPYALLSLLDVDTGDITAVERLPLANATPVLDSEDRARFVVGYDKDNLLAVAWKSGTEWTTFNLPGFRYINPARLTPDGRGLLFVSTRSDESVNALYRVDLESHDVSKVYGDSKTPIYAHTTDLSKDIVIGVRTYADRQEYHWLEPHHPDVSLYQMLERAFPNQSVTITSASRDRKLAIAHVDSDINPGEYYLLDTQAKKAELLMSTRSWVDTTKMRHMEPFEMKARDGLVLHGYLVRPRDGAGPYPLVVMPHGRPFQGRDRWSFDWQAQLLAHYGYAVLQPNYRGSEGYGEDFARAGYREWGAKMQDDVTDVTLWAVAQGIAENNNICIFGLGYGGYSALMGAVREPALYRCAASFGAPTDLELFRNRETADSALTDSYTERVFGDDVQLLRARSPAFNAERIQVPILLLHDKADTQMSYEHATRMRDALRKADKKVELVSLKGKGPGAYDEKSVENAYAKLLDFLAANLRGGHPPKHD